MNIPKMPVGVYRADTYIAGYKTFPGHRKSKGRRRTLHQIEIGDGKGTMLSSHYYLGGLVRSTMFHQTETGYEAISVATDGGVSQTQQHCVNSNPKYTIISIYDRHGPRIATESLRSENLITEVRKNKDNEVSGVKWIHLDSSGEITRVDEGDLNTSIFLTSDFYANGLRKKSIGLLRNGEVGSYMLFAHDKMGNCTKQVAYTRLVSSLPFEGWTRTYDYSYDAQDNWIRRLMSMTIHPEYRGVPDVLSMYGGPDAVTKPIRVYHRLLYYSLT